MKELACDNQNDTRLRLLAIIYVKNGIDRYWRKGAPHAIQLDEKTHIKQTLMGTLDEAHANLALQFAVSVGKIARYDFPVDWPDLLTGLIGLLEGGHGVRMRNALLHLHHVIKVLSSKTIPASRRQFQQAAPIIFSQLSPAYAQGMQRLVSSPDVEDFAMVVSCIKIIRRLIVFGFNDFSTHPEIVNFLHLTLQHVQFITQTRPSWDGTPMFKLASSARHTIGKLYLELEQANVVSSMTCEAYPPILRYYWHELAHPTLVPVDEYADKFTIQALLLWKGVLKPQDFDPPKGETPDAKVAVAKDLVASQLVTPEFIAEAMTLLISKYTIFSQSDLQSWEEDPEGFLEETQADHWEYNPKTCAEKLIIDLIHTHSEKAIPVLKGMVERVAQIAPGCTLEQALVKDSVYNTVGLTANALHDHIDFDTWLTRVLSTEALAHAPSWQIVHRAVLQMIGYWVSVKIAPSNRPLVYQVMLQSMQSDRDLVVRLAAVANLQACIDEWDFQPKSFESFLRPALMAFGQLLSDVEEFNTKMMVLNCMSVIIERMEMEILPYAVEITRLLPPLWDAAEDQHMFRAAILVMIAKLINALTTQSHQLHELVLPLIGSTVDMTNPGFIYQLEEGLELWLATVQNAVEPSQPLASLVLHLPKLLEYGTEGLKKLLKIVESYALLDPSTLLSNQQVLPSMETLIGDMRPEAATHIIHTLDILAQAAAANNQLPSFCQNMQSSGLINRMLNLVFEGAEMDMIIVGYLSLFSRLAIHDPRHFVDWIAAPELLDRLVGVMVDKMDAVTHPKRRKLISMVMLHFLSLAPHQLDGVFAVLSSELSNLKETGEFVFYST
jgi:hypothetical protein